MKKENTYRLIFWIIILSISFIINQNTHATHAQSADITYQCLGANQYEVGVSFYQDFAAVKTPSTNTINTTSATCAQNFNTTLFQIPGTGIDVSPIYNTMVSECNGGNMPGVEESVYRGIINLTNQCNAISSLTAGIYLLSVTNANECIANTQYTITEPTTLVTNGIMEILEQPKRFNLPHQKPIQSSRQMQMGVSGH
jgi:hypothetical protein